MKKRWMLFVYQFFHPSTGAKKVDKNGGLKMKNKKETGI
jgi:hypothetical protein